MRDGKVIAGTTTMGDEFQTGSGHALEQDGRD